VLLYFLKPNEQVSAVYSAIGLNARAIRDATSCQQTGKIDCALNIESGNEIEIRGIVPYSKLTVYIHRLKFKIDHMKFDAPVGISESDDWSETLKRWNVSLANYILKEWIKISF
jgi:exo-beta-1,3-glucanase (GH17 family)